MSLTNKRRLDLSSSLDLVAMDKRLCTASQWRESESGSQSGGSSNRSDTAGSENDAEYKALMDAAKYLDGILCDIVGQKDMSNLISTAEEVLCFSKGAVSLHFGEYPAKVHWSALPDPVSNPCCVLASDVLQHEFALVDLVPLRPKGLSGDLVYPKMLSTLKKNSRYRAALNAYLKCTIKYFSCAKVYPIWGRTNSWFLKSILKSGKLVLPDGRTFFPILHPSGHGNRGSDTNHATKIYQLQEVRARAMDPVNWEECLRVIIEAERLRARLRKEQLRESGMRDIPILAQRPAILHLAEVEWVKRIGLARFLKEKDVTGDVLEKFFYLTTLRFESLEIVKAGIERVCSVLGLECSEVCAVISSSGTSGINRLVRCPDVFLESLELFAKKLGQELPKVWSTICSIPGAIKAIVDNPQLLMQSLEDNAKKLGKTVSEVFQSKAFLVCDVCNMTFGTKHCLESHIFSVCSPEAQIAQEKKMTAAAEKAARKLVASQIAREKEMKAAAERAERAREDAARHFVCHFALCGKIYTSRANLKGHILLKHT